MRITSDDLKFGHRFPAGEKSRTRNQHLRIPQAGAPAFGIAVNPKENPGKKSLTWSSSSAAKNKLSCERGKKNLRET